MVTGAATQLLAFFSEEFREGMQIGVRVFYGLARGLQVLGVISAIPGELDPRRGQTAASCAAAIQPPPVVQF